MAHVRQPRPDSGLGVQVKVLKTFQVVPSSLKKTAGRDAMKEFQAVFSLNPASFSSSSLLSSLQLSDTKLYEP
jgi:hypothetical protein